MSKSKWGFDEIRKEGELIGELKRSKETAYEMFIDGKNIIEIRKY